MLTFWPLVRRVSTGDHRTCDRAAADACPRSYPLPPAAPRLVDRRGVVRDPDRRRRIPVRAERADGPVARRVRLVARDDLGGGVGQPAAVRADLAVRGGADGAGRAADRGRVRAHAGGGREWPDRVHDRELAAAAVLGTARRDRRRVDGNDVRRDRDRALVRAASRARDRCADRRRRDRAARLPAAGGRARDPVRLAHARTGGGRLRAGRRTAGVVVPARLPERCRDHRVRRSARQHRRPAGSRDRRRAARSDGAARRGAAADVLAARGRVRGLRRVHERAGRNPFRDRPHDHGMPQTTAASLLALVGVFDVGGTILSGWLTDRWDPRWLLVGYYTLRGLSLLVLPSLLAPQAEPSIWVFVVFYGLDWIATVPPTVALCREWFGAEGPIVFGWVFASHQVGAALMAEGAGGIRDLQGSYDLAWYLARSEEHTSELQSRGHLVCRL